MGGAVDWAVEVTRHTLTLPQVRPAAAADCRRRLQAPACAAACTATADASSSRPSSSLSQLLEHLEQLEKMEAAVRGRSSSGGLAKARSSGAGAQQHRVSWVEHSTSTAASLMEGILSDAESSSEDDLLAAVAALPPHLLTPAQQAAVVLQAWEGAAHTKPASLDADAQLTVPGLAGAPAC